MDTKQQICFKRRKVSETNERTNKYNVWKNNPSALIPVKTSERWKRNLNKSLSGIPENTTDTQESSDAERMSVSSGSDKNYNSESGENSEYERNNSEMESNTSDADDSIADFDINQQKPANYLYKDCKLTVEEAVLKILDMFVKHKMPKTAFKAQLKLINSLLPAGNKMLKTAFKFFKYVEDQAPPSKIIKHYFCKKCLLYISTEVCRFCGDGDISFFYEIDVKDQLKRLFEINNLSEKLMKITFEEDLIKDICDGSEYRRVNSNRNIFDLTLIMYTDGISLIKSKNSHCWPLMFVIAELPPQIRYKNIIIAGIWYDDVIKPPMNLFLRPFCEKIVKMKKIKWKHPITGELHNSNISAPLFIADAPARAQIQNILNFNGEYGCNICNLKTIACENITGKKLIRMYPHKEQLHLRNAKEMENQANIVEKNGNLAHYKGVKGSTVISCLPMIDISTCVVPEFMHSVLLGVTKQFLNVWINKKGPWRIKKNIDTIDDFLLKIRPIQKFYRMPRSLKSFHLYKATELFNWLIYYSLPILKDNIPEIYLEHWMLLVTSIYNLVQQHVKINTDIKEAEVLLNLFVKEIPLLYSDRELSYNVHQLLHLGLAVRRWGPLWATSAFPFEDKNGFISRSVHGTRHLKQEIVNNIRIAQGATMLKNRVDSVRSTSVERIEVLGKHKKFTANSIQQNLIVLKGLDPKKCLFFSRAKVKEAIFTSTLYKTTKTNSFTVKLKYNEFQKYVIIICFIKHNNTFYLLVQNLDIIKENRFVHKKTKSFVKHIKPFKTTNNFNVIRFEHILSMKHVMQVGNYICKISNTYNTIF